MQRFVSTAVSLLPFARHQGLICGCAHYDTVVRTVAPPSLSETAFSQPVWFDPVLAVGRHLGTSVQSDLYPYREP